MSTRAAREEARRSLRIGLAVGAVIAILVGWSAWKVFSGGHSAYPEVVRTQFLAGCEHYGGAVATCGCILNWFESHKSLAEFTTIAGEMRADEGISWDVYAGLNSCDPSF